MIQFTNFVGTSPGTTTMEVPAMNLGACPPGYYGQNIMLPGSGSYQAGSSVVTTSTVAVNPYGTESRLSGLRGTIRWDLLLLTFGLAFAGVLGYAVVKRKRK
jgi:hypothetical protein